MALVSAYPAARQALARRAGARGATGAVACASPMAAAAGTAALLDGGTCVDAALAAAFVETVVLAPKCGPAGDVVALHLSPGAAGPEALLAIGPAPTGLSGFVHSRGILPATGGPSVGVPGAPAGYAALAGRGRLGLDRLVAPAVALARRGFSWTPQCATLAAEADQLLVRLQPSGCRFRPAGGPLAVGERVRLPGLADLLEQLARRGRGLFAGPVGDALVAAATADGGVITPDDLGRVVPEWAPAPSVELGGSTLWSTPGPTYGPALLDALRRCAGDMTKLPDAVRTTLGQQAARAGDGTAFATEGTSVVAAADAEGGAVVLVHSNSFPQFGSGLVVTDFDLVLSNRAGRGFDTDPSRPNFPSPSRRPLTTLHAWSLQTGPRVLVGGTPGGLQQVPWNAQVLTAILKGDDPGDAVCRPLWRLDGSVTVAEEGYRHPVDEVIPDFTMRSAQVIVSPPDAAGMAASWADPRSDALALAV